MTTLLGHARFDGYLSREERDPHDPCSVVCLSCLRLAMLRRDPPPDGIEVERYEDARGVRHEHVKER